MKKYLLTSTPFVFSFTCLVLYHHDGIQIAEDGTLIESFFYIPLSYLSFAIGILAIILQMIISIYSKNKLPL